MGEGSAGYREVLSFRFTRRSRIKATAGGYPRSGLTDWVRSVADQLAEAGYIAIARLSFRAGPKGGGTAEPAQATACGGRSVIALPPGHR